MFMETYMGIFSNLFFSLSQQDQSQPESKNEDTLESDAFDFFDEEEIRCASSVDRDTIKFIYKSLYNNNRDTSNGIDMRDGLQTLDNNVYYFAKSLFYQNFMLMRKVDRLTDKIDALEIKLDKYKKDTPLDDIT